MNYKPSQVYETVKNIILANDKLMEKGQTPISVSIEGKHGIGKTSVCKELCQDMNRPYFKLNLAQLTEPSELIGFYSKEFLLLKDNEELWVTENLIPKFTSEGYKYTSKIRTVSCPPEWVHSLEMNSILLLDDFSRGNALFSQAVMELVNCGEMVGWNLREKNVQIILSENPSDGEYNTASLDAAQTDRMIKINMIWDAKDWAARAEKIGLDHRLINFVLWKPELFEDYKKDGISASGQVSPRMLDKFFSLVSTIEEFDKNLDKIMTFGDISVGSGITNELIAFINKKLDKLPTIHDLIKENTLVESKKILTKICGDVDKDSKKWNSATSAILTVRMYNYMIYNHKTTTKEQINQYLELILHSSFSLDQKYLMVIKTIGISSEHASILAGDPRFLEHLKN
jgi:MoxR-like ATPase